MERSLVPRAGVPAFFFPMAPPVSLSGLALLSLATARSLLLVRRLQPGVTFATGGYVSGPAALASWLQNVPLVLFLPDVVPGKAVQVLLPLARKIAVSTDASLRDLPAHKAVVTGYPVREAFLQTSKVQGRERFKVSVDATLLCVFGGSQGARSINKALIRCLPDLLSDYHVIHVCGEKRLSEVQAVKASLPTWKQDNYQLFPYLHDQDMADALAAADLVLCRSGASTLGELPATGTPAVLVPFPDPGVHQRENAAYLAERGAAVVLEDEALGERLGFVLGSLLGDRERLEQMADAARALARPDAAASIASLILESAA